MKCLFKHTIFCFKLFIEYLIECLFNFNQIQQGLLTLKLNNQHYTEFVINQYYVIYLN